MTEYLRIPTEAGTFDAIAAGPEDGRNVLFLHGFPEAGVAWTDQVDALGAAGFRAVAPDQRGYSPDVRPADVRDYQIADLTGDVLAIADALGWRAFDLVGHDWGATIAWLLAAEHPDRVRTLTAVSMPHPSPFGEALREDEDQVMRAQHLQLYRSGSGTAEKRLLADDAAGLRMAFDRRVSAVATRRLPDQAARTGRADGRAELVPGHAADAAGGGQDHRADHVRVEHRGRHGRLDGGAGHRGVGERAVPVRDAGGRLALGARGGTGSADRAAAGSPAS